MPGGREVDDNINLAAFRQTNDLSCLPAARPDTTVSILAHAIWLSVVLEVRQDPAVLHLARRLCHDSSQLSIHAAGDCWSTHQVVVKRDNLLDPAVGEIPRRHILVENEPDPQNSGRKITTNIVLPSLLHPMPFVQVTPSCTSGASRQSSESAYIFPNFDPCSNPMVPAMKRPLGSTAPSLNRFSFEARVTEVGIRFKSCLDAVGGNGMLDGGMNAKKSSATAMS